MKSPLYREISYHNPEQIFAQFAQQKGAVFLDSAQLMLECGRYSFIAVDPFNILQSKNGEAPWQHLSSQLALFPLEVHPELPPFQGGVVGFFGYDLYQHLEKIAGVQSDDMEFPDIILGFYDLVLAFDHELKRAWIFSSGYPLQEPSAREVRAKERCEWLLKQLNNEAIVSSDRSYSSQSLTSNFTREQYCEAVQKVKDYILAGDIFEANISQRFRVAMNDGFEAYDLYQRLRKTNPAPFSAYLNFGETILASASPERFLKLKQRDVETRPIKGTRRRGKTPDEDKQLAAELMQSEKDHSENVMIVDLLRNDLSRVCEDHTVKVPQLCGLESYASVHHLVSVVKGRLCENCDACGFVMRDISRWFNYRCAKSEGDGNYR